MTPYRCILADPPWAESGGGRIKRGADRWYELMKTKDIVDLMNELLYGKHAKQLDSRFGDPIPHAPRFPVAGNAHLWLWVTNNFLRDGLEVMKALGFRYVTNLAWAKMKFYAAVIGSKNAWLPEHPGLGQYLAGRHELLLFGVRGKLPALWKDKESGAQRQGTLICSPRRKHSEKPPEAYDVIENVSPGPRIELFARGEARPGWDTWGDEAHV